jgi:hypothetical protein
LSQEAVGVQSGNLSEKAGKDMGGELNAESRKRNETDVETVRREEWSNSSIATTVLGLWSEPPCIPRQLTGRAAHVRIEPSN